MAIQERSLFNETPRNAGEVPVNHPSSYIRTLIAEEVIKFGRAIMFGSDPSKFAKILAGSGKKFLGVSGLSYEATGLNTVDANSGTVGQYAAKDMLGFVDEAFVSVFVEEAVGPTDPVRVRIAQEAKTSGYQEVSSTPTEFVGATVPAIADATYDLDIDIDGGGINQLAFALVNTDDWDAVAAAIQAALQTATGNPDTVVISGGKILVTSQSTGSGSTVAVTAGTAGSGGGDLLDYIDNNVANMTTTIETAVPGSDDPSAVKEPGNFATTAEVGKTALVKGVSFVGQASAAGLVIVKLEPPFITIDD